MLIHQNKVLCLRPELDTGTALGGAANNWRPMLRPNEERSEAREDHEEQPDAVKSERHGEVKKVYNREPFR